MWFDAPTWIHQQLTAALTGWLVTPETDAKVNAFPALVWSLALSNPDGLGIWSGNLTLSLLCDPASAEANVALVHDTLQGWQTPGPLHAVELVSFTQSRSTVSKNTHQYVFVYSLTWDL